jgi:cell wall-associated NlpC family hydrolase
MRVAFSQIISPRFRWNGRYPDDLDCYGVVLWYFAQLGIVLDDPRDEYGEGWKERGEHPIRDRFSKPWAEAPKPWREHDVVLLMDPGDTEPAHLGVFVAGGRKILHAHPKHGVVCWPTSVLVPLIWAVARHEDLA